MARQRKPRKGPPLKAVKAFDPTDVPKADTVDETLGKHLELADEGSDAAASAPAEPPAAPPADAEPPAAAPADDAPDWRFRDVPEAERTRAFPPDHDRALPDTVIEGKGLPPEPPAAAPADATPPADKEPTVKADSTPAVAPPPPAAAEPPADTAPPASAASESPSEPPAAPAAPAEPAPADAPPQRVPRIQRVKPAVTVPPRAASPTAKPPAYTIGGIAVVLVLLLLLAFLAVQVAREAWEYLDGAPPPIAEQDEADEEDPRLLLDYAVVEGQEDHRGILLRSPSGSAVRCRLLDQDSRGEWRGVKASCEDANPRRLAGATQ